MTCDHTPSHKAYVGNNNKPNIVFTILPYSLVQKLLSTILLMVLCGGCLLLIGSSCNQKSNDLSKVMQSDCTPNHATRLRCVGTVTTLAMGDRVGYIMVEHNPQPSKWKKSLSKIRFLLYGKRSIPSEHLRCLIDHEDYGTFKPSGIAADRSDCVVARHPIDDGMPNWKVYGITPFMPCQRSMLGHKHTFSLDLDGAKFQNGEQLGFILVKNNRSPVDLVKHLLKTFVPWPDQPHQWISIKDYLMLPGVIKQYALQNECFFNSFTDLNRYTTIYCYLKKDHHYCFIRLENIVPPVKTAHSAFVSLGGSNALASSLQNGGSRLPVAPLSLKQDTPLDALPPIHRLFAEDEPITHTYGKGRPQINTHTHGEGRPQNLWDECKAAGGDLYGGTIVHNSALSITFQDAAMVKMKQEALSEVLKNVKSIKMRQENVIEIIKRTNSVASNDEPKNEIQLSLENKIESTLRLALEAIRGLQSALKLEKGYQLGIEYSSNPTDLSDQRRAVIKALENLTETLYDAYLEVESVEKSLTVLIEYFDTVYHILFNLFRLDEIDGMEDSVKQLFIGDRMQLKKAQDIITQLEKTILYQQNESKNFRKTISDMEETLVAIRKNLVTFIGDPLKLVIRRLDSSALKRNLKLEVNIVEGKVKNLKRIEEIIMDLELEEEDIQAILEGSGLRTLKTEIADIGEKIEEAVNEALGLQKQFQKVIQSKAKEIVQQIEAFKELLPKMDACYDAQYEAA